MFSSENHCVTHQKNLSQVSLMSDTKSPNVRSDSLITINQFRNKPDSCLIMMISSWVRDLNEHEVASFFRERSTIYNRSIEFKFVCIVIIPWHVPTQRIPMQINMFKLVNISKDCLWWLYCSYVTLWFDLEHYIKQQWKKWESYL